MAEREEWIEGEIKLKIEGRPLELKVSVPAKPVTVRRMLPVFREMANAFVGLGEKDVQMSGKQISCKAGCGACCRQAVPLSVPEAYDMAKLVEEMPEPRRSEIRERFRRAREHFEGIDWFEQLGKATGLSRKERNDLGVEYFREGVPCPFLEEESCSIHEHRPLACREYLVTSPAEKCSELNGEEIEIVPLAVKPAATLCAAVKSANLGTVVNFVPLVLALEWAKKYPEDLTERTGEEWMATFFRSLTKSEIPGFGGRPHS